LKPETRNAFLSVQVPTAMCADGGIDFQRRSQCSASIVEAYDRKASLPH
jgi:hypothetical protein